MKYWIIEFQGIYPVGAVAVARADVLAGAAGAFHDAWKQHHPGLAVPTITRIEPLVLEDGAAVILLDGDY